LTSNTYLTQSPLKSKSKAIFFWLLFNFNVFNIACRVKQLETVRFELCTKNADLQHKIVALQTKSHEVLSQGLPQDKETIQELELKVKSALYSKRGI
jgi:hypothetical protein